MRSISCLKVNNNKFFLWIIFVLISRFLTGFSYSFNFCLKVSTFFILFYAAMSSYKFLSENYYILLYFYIVNRCIKNPFTGIVDVILFFIIILYGRFFEYFYKIFIKIIFFYFDNREFVLLRAKRKSSLYSSTWHMILYIIPLSKE